MAPKVPAPKKPQHTKRKRIPPTHRISKRRALRPSIPSPYASSSNPKIIYISCTSPFFSVVTRVRKLLSLADKRAMGKISLENKTSEAQMLRLLEEERERKRRNEGEEIVLRAMGKAIEKALELAVYFQGQEEFKVRIGTGTVSVVDDIVEVDDEGGGDGGGGGDKMDTGEKDIEGEEVPETQIRRTSMLEVGIRSR